MPDAACFLRSQTFANHGRDKTSALVRHASGAGTSVGGLRWRRFEELSIDILRAVPMARGGGSGTNAPPIAVSAPSKHRIQMAKVGHLPGYLRARRERNGRTLQVCCGKGAGDT